MKGKFKYCILTMIVLTVLLIGKGSSVYCVETGSLYLELGIVTSDGSDQTLTDRFTFYMEAEDENSPMPDGIEETLMELVVSGEGSFDIGTIEYDEPGDYVYKIYQVSGDNSSIDYDDAIYTLTVSVTNGDELGELETTVTIIKNDNYDEKYDAFIFENLYNVPQEEVDTGDNVYIYVIMCIISLVVVKYSLRKMVR